MTIFTCTFVMFFYTYSLFICQNNETLDSETCQEVYKNDINRDKTLDIVLIVFDCFFMFEMVCKIIAQGLVLHKNAYLRDVWNMLDCFVTLYSFFNKVVPSEQGQVPFRVIRLIRVLKTIDRIEGLRRLIISIMVSLETLANVLIFLAFVYLVFGILGVQMFSGAFYNRCRSYPIDLNMTNEFGARMFSCPPVGENICTANDSSGMFNCSAGLYCVNFFKIPVFFGLNESNITIDSFNITEEGLETSPFFFYGSSKFDDFISSLINVFGIMTYQGWTDLYNVLIDGTSEFGTKVYFMSVVTIGGFFIMKLILAAQNEALIKVRIQEKEQKIKLIRRCSSRHPDLIKHRNLTVLLEDEKAFKEFQKQVKELSQSKPLYLSPENKEQKRTIPAFSPKIIKTPRINNNNEGLDADTKYGTTTRKIGLFSPMHHKLSSFNGEDDINDRSQTPLKGFNYNNLGLSLIHNNDEILSRGQTLSTSSDITFSEELVIQHSCKDLNIKLMDLVSNQEAVDTYLYK